MSYDLQHALAEVERDCGGADPRMLALGRRDRETGAVEIVEAQAIGTTRSGVAVARFGLQLPRGRIVSRVAVGLVLGGRVVAALRLNMRDAEELHRLIGRALDG